MGAKFADNLADFINKFCLPVLKLECSAGPEIIMQEDNTVIQHDITHFLYIRNESGLAILIKSYLFP